MQQLNLSDPQQKVQQIMNFLQKTFQNTGKDKAVIAVSGGIDSALSLTLLSRALSAEQIYPIFLPYKNQSVEDSKLICEFNNIPSANWQEVNIGQLIDSFKTNLQIEGENKVRLGNIMARCRMIVIYDLAKKIDALVCGTENKSEKYLGYFSRFGDEASDVEPILSLYKAQVRQLSKFLELPDIFVTKDPSAGLWQGQTDEQELGFSYDDADQVLYYLIDQKQTREQIVSSLPNIDLKTIKQIIARVKSMEFKHQVPYKLS